MSVCECGVGRESMKENMRRDGERESLCWRESVCVSDRKSKGERYLNGSSCSLRFMTFSHYGST